MTMPDKAVEAVATLFDAIAHGDDEHRAWLKEAIDAHFAGQPVPEMRGQGRKEARIAELEAQIAAMPRDEVVGELVEALEAAAQELFPRGVVLAGQRALVEQIETALAKAKAMELTNAPSPDECLEAAWTLLCPQRMKTQGFPNGFWPDVGKVAVIMMARGTTSLTLADLDFRPTMASRGDMTKPEPAQSRAKRRAENTAALLAELSGVKS